MATDIEQRLVILEREVVRMGVALAAARAIAEKALQDARLGSGLGFGGGAGLQLAYFPSGMTALVGTTPGTGTFQLVSNQAETLTASGNTADSGLTADNLTSGSSTSGGYGLVVSIGGVYYAVVYDCGGGSSPPAVDTTTGTTTGTGTSVPGGSGVMALSPTVTGTGSSFASGSGVPIPPGPGYSSGGTDSGSGE